jgi:hypothetical protein
MKRYHEEKALMENRARMYNLINAGWLAYEVPNTSPEKKRQTPIGRYRKALRCGGCGRSRCQVCHSDKFPKRILTRKEQQALEDDNLRQFELGY